MDDRCVDDRCVDDRCLDEGSWLTSVSMVSFSSSSCTLLSSEGGGVETGTDPLSSLTGLGVQATGLGGAGTLGGGEIGRAHV